MGGSSIIVVSLCGTDFTMVYMTARPARKIGGVHAGGRCHHEYWSIIPVIGLRTCSHAYAQYGYIRALTYLPIHVALGNLPTCLAIAAVRMEPYRRPSGPPGARGI